MTQKDKEVLLKDLYARLPYGIKAEIKYYDGAWELLAIYTNGTTYATRDVGYPIETCFEECKPYLFPMSSMTDKQKKELEDTLIKMNLKALSDELNSEDIAAYEIDFYNKNHFDYRDLIEKGLALDATGLNIY